MTGNGQTDRQTDRGTNAGCYLHTQSHYFMRDSDTLSTGVCLSVRHTRVLYPNG